VKPASWRRGIPAALAALALVGTACSGGEAGGGSGETISRPVLPAPSAIMPARYVTDVAYVGFGSSAPVAALRFRHDVSTTSLERRYRIWIGQGGRWSSVLSSTDTLPVPRAAWRVLPGHGLRVLAASGGDLEGLVFRAAQTAFQLQPGKVLDEWTSPTGQRSRLLLATWAEGGEPMTGMVFERREARPFDSPPPRTLEQAVLLADPAGDGLLVLRDTGGDDPDRTATTAYSWIGGQEARWPEQRVDFAPGDGQTGWTLSIADVGLQATLILAPLVADDSVVADSLSSDAGVRIHGLRGTLRVGGRARSVHGLTILARGP